MDLSTLRRLTLLLATLPLSGCASCLGLPDYVVLDPGTDAGDSATPNDSAPVCPGVPDDSTACGQCTATKCCEELQTCAWTPDCAALIACLQACAASRAEQTCGQKCLDAHPGSVALFGAIAKCQSVRCASTCADLPDAAADSPEETADSKTQDEVVELDQQSDAGDSTSDGQDEQNDAAAETPDDAPEEDGGPME